MGIASLLPVCYNKGAMENKIDLKEKNLNKMGYMPIGKLMLTMSVPLVISMLVQAMYNVVDSYFVAELSNDALNAVSLAYPMQMLMVSFAVGTGIGMNAYIARCLGMGENERANKGASNGLFMLMITGLVFTVLGFFTEPFFKLFTDDPMLIDLGVRYLRICMVFGMGQFIQIGCERILQAMGKNTSSMLAQLAGAIVNIILDPMMIFGLGPFSEMGIEGAAYATVIGQWVGMIISIMLIIFGKHEVKLSYKNFRIHGETVKEIYRVGAPAIVMQSISSFMTVGLNAILSRLLESEIGVTIVGVYFKLQSIIFMPLFGVTAASMSIMSYNYGAGSRTRFTQTFRKTLVTALVIMLVGLAAFQLFPDTLIGLFDKDGSLSQAGAVAFRIISLHFPIAAIGITISNTFQSLAKGIHSMMMSLFRQLCVLLPAALVLALVFGNIESVWWAFFVAEFASAAYGVIFLKKEWKTHISVLER